MFSCSCEFQIKYQNCDYNKVQDITKNMSTIPFFVVSDLNALMIQRKTFVTNSKVFCKQFNCAGLVYSSWFHNWITSLTFEHLNERNKKLGICLKMCQHVLTKIKNSKHLGIQLWKNNT